MKLWEDLVAEPGACPTCKGHAGKRVKLPPQHAIDNFLPLEEVLAAEGERAIGVWRCADCGYGTQKLQQPEP